MATNPKVNQSKPKKQHKFNIPVQQRAKIAQMFASGMSQRKVAKKIGRCRITVARVLAAEDMEAARIRGRGKIFAMIDEACDTVYTDIVDKSQQTGNPEMAFLLLERTGSMPPEVATKVPTQEELDAMKTITLSEDEAEEEGVKKYMGKCLDMAWEKSKTFKTPFPELEDEEPPKVDKKLKEDE